MQLAGAFVHDSTDPRYEKMEVHARADCFKRRHETMVLIAFEVFLYSRLIPSYG